MKKLSFQEIHMNSALEFLKANQVFHLATVDGKQARVRPFGFVMKRNERLYMCTGKAKDVYKQMVQNPDIEISAMGPDGTWLRICGSITFDDSRDTKVQAFEESPMLLQIYTQGPDDPNYVTFYFTEAKATLYSFTGAPKELPLF